SCRTGRQRELSVRREQLELLRDERTRVAEGEIRQAAATIETELRRLQLARRVVDLWQKRIPEMQQEREVGRFTFFDLSAARLKSLEAQEQLVHRLVAWKIAHMKLK